MGPPISSCAWNLKDRSRRGSLGRTNPKSEDSHPGLARTPHSSASAPTYPARSTLLHPFLAGKAACTTEAMRRRDSSQHHNFLSNIKKPFKSPLPFGVGREGVLWTAAPKANFPVPQQIQQKDRAEVWGAKHLQFPLSMGEASFESQSPDFKGCTRLTNWITWRWKNIAIVQNCKEKLRNKNTIKALRISKIFCSTRTLQLLSHRTGYTGHAIFIAYPDIASDVQEDTMTTTGYQSPASCISLHNLHLTQLPITVLGHSGWEATSAFPLGKTQTDLETLYTACHHSWEGNFMGHTGLCTEYPSLGLFGPKWLL